MAEIKIKGTVEKIVRANGKNDAQLVITIPVVQSTEVPLGAVSLSIQSLQSSMFGKDNDTAVQTSTGKKKGAK